MDTKLNIKKVTVVNVAAAKALIKVNKKLNEPIEEDTIKIANAKRTPDPSLPEDEVQYILED